jgi:transposase
MSDKKWVVDLSPEERGQLLALLRKGKVAAQRLRRAHSLLHADEGLADEAIAELLYTNRSTVERTRRRLVEEGLEAALSERPRPGAAAALDQKGRATLLALACSNPPEGRACWTMQRLADELVERKVVGAISDETVRRVLKNTGWRPGCASAGASPR